MNQVTASTGNVVDAKGKPLTPDQFLDVMERIEMSFDQNGKPMLPQIVCGPQMVEQMKKILEQIDTEPELKQRHDELLRRKRENWCDRESRRKLVD